MGDVELSHPNEVTAAGRSFVFLGEMLTRCLGRQTAVCCHPNRFDIPNTLVEKKGQTRWGTPHMIVRATYNLTDAIFDNTTVFRRHCHG